MFSVAPGQHYFRHTHTQRLLVVAIMHSFDAKLWACRLLSLKASYPAQLAHDWADLQAIAAQAPGCLRLAFLMGAHSRYVPPSCCLSQQMRGRWLAILTAVQIWPCEGVVDLHCVTDFHVGVAGAGASVLVL